MNYICDLKTGQQLRIENEGSQTHVGFTSNGPGQRQSQSTGFQTGEWSKDPEVFQLGEDIIIQLKTKEGKRLIRAGRDRIQFIDEAPDLATAEKLEIRESSNDSGFKPMEPMKWMEPMKPMKPMKWW